MHHARTLLAALMACACMQAAGGPLPEDPLDCPPSRSPKPERGDAAAVDPAGDVAARLLDESASPAVQLLALLPESEWPAVQRFEVQPRVLVDGERKAFNAPAFLVERGIPIRLKVEFSTPLIAEKALSSAPESASGAASVIRKVAWHGTATDRFTPAADGTTMLRMLATEGASSDITVEVAELHLRAGAPPVLLSGASAVTLLPGLLFDRSGDGLLEGVPIGVYPSETAAEAPEIVRDHAKQYAPPRLFYRLDDASRGVILAPHVTLHLLNPPAIHGEDAPVRHVAFDRRMERFWSAFNQITMEEGLDAHGLRVLRGFVSPNERARLARQGVELSQYSRHMYGDCIAIVLDRNEATYMTEPRMSDINKDGRADLADVEVLAAIAEKTMRETGMWGGVGVCGKFGGPGPSTGTPYLHIDLRGWHVPFREE